MMDRNSLLRAVVTAVVVFSISNAVAQPGTLRPVKIGQFDFNLLRVMEYGEELQQRFGDISDERAVSIFDLTDFDSLGETEKLPANARMRYSLAFPAAERGYIFFGVLPNMGGAVIEEEDIRGDPAGLDGATEGMPLVTRDGYVGVAQAEVDSLDSPEDEESDSETPRPLSPEAESLRPLLLKEVEQTLNSDNPFLVRLLLQPAELQKTFVWKELLALRATLFTYAQSRDGEHKVPAEYRSAWYRVLADLIQAATKDLIQIELTLKKNEAADACVSELRLKPRSKSDLRKHFREVSRTDARCLSWLHPQNEGFVSISSPVASDDLNALETLHSVTGPWLREELKLPESAVQPLDQCLESLLRHRRIEALFQVVLDEDDEPVILLTLPHDVGSGVSESIVQLVNYEEDADVFEMNVAEVAGYGLHELGSDVIDDSLPDHRVYMLGTDNSLTICVCRRDRFDVLEQVVERNFEPPVAASTYRRSAISGELPIDSWLSRYILGKDDELIKEVSEKEVTQPAKVRVWTNVDRDGLSFHLESSGDSGFLASEFFSYGIFLAIAGLELAEESDE